MPKTKKKFDWEIYENGEFVDILSMTSASILPIRSSL